MWTIKTFKTKDAMRKFVEKNQDRIEYQEIFINNLYGIEYRKLRIVYIY